MKERPFDSFHSHDILARENYTAKNRSVVARGWSVVRKVDYKDQQGILRTDGTALYLDYGGSYMSVCVCQNLQNCALKRVTSTVCKINLNLKIKIKKQSKTKLGFKTKFHLTEHKMQNLSILSLYHKSSPLT